jgi:8-oxo-dGTP diphosphatase
MLARARRYDHREINDRRKHIEGKSIRSTSRMKYFASAIIIDTLGRFLFQQRDDIRGIIYPGKVGLFGGHREGDETYLECVVREIHEELSYFVPAEHFEYVAGLDGADIDERGRFSAEFFVARNIPVHTLVVTEGSLVIIKPNELRQIESKLTPSAKFAMKAYLGKCIFA